MQTVLLGVKDKVCSEEIETVKGILRINLGKNSRNSVTFTEGVSHVKRMCGKCKEKLS